ncbi:diguanylate cyclase [Geobacter sulfurreducens]|uniref:diguanylate cyclase n=1 Tax=Geobacter sulfurreducens TaxID=35554 RepID=UPI0020B7D840|nr:diguanylate cyclase [Geobacter sulfurreducens]UTG93577.1 diguanylate cyclase [Geobacter sulfurreducens]
MPHVNLTTIQPVELLEALKSHQFLAPYHLTFCCDQDGGMPRYKSRFTVCGSPRQYHFCTNSCMLALENAVGRAIAGNRPVVFQCSVGLLNFAVPLRAGDIPFTCLIGGGVRDKSIDLARMESLAAADGMDAFALLAEFEELPVATVDEVEEVARKVQELVPSLLARNLHSQIFEKTMQRLTAISGISTGIDTADSVCDLMTLISETLGVLFDISKIAVLIPQNGPTSPYTVKGIWGLQQDLGTIPGPKALGMFPRDRAGCVVLQEDECHSIFPDLDVSQATCLRLASGQTVHGILVLFDASIPPREELLVSLVTGKAATQLARMREKDKYTSEIAQARELLTMFSALSRTESKDQLNEQILGMAADLVDATCGSLMFIDESGSQLKIESALGMNLHLAQSMVVQVGTGIAGKVAASGNPLLVNDIEKDRRVGTPNRPRFKTKSFVSIPIKLREDTIGVLNLSDKKNQGIFTDADLKILITFTDHASIMIERALSIERADILEQLSITDHLTGLYNRRFLKRRMEEELARSIRHNLNLTVMLIDLDHFKIYNDLCGHLAGDRALKRTAKILSETARQMDVVTRFGGEEFCIILPGTSKKESIFVAERIRREIEGEEFPHEENLPLGRLTASIGIASFPEDGSTEASLVKAADVALYRAKSDGRNRVIIAGNSVDDHEKISRLKTALNLP